jgi:hypothetical protein
LSAQSAKRPIGHARHRRHKNAVGQRIGTDFHAMKSSFTKIDHEDMVFKTPSALQKTIE